MNRITSDVLLMKFHSYLVSNSNISYYLKIKPFVEYRLPACYAKPKIQNLTWKIKTYLLNGLFTNSATVSLDNRALILVIYVILNGVSSTASSDIITCNLRSTTIYQFSFPLLLSLINIGLSIALGHLLFHSFSTSTTYRSGFRGHRLLLMLFNLSSFLLRNTLWLFYDLNPSVLWK